MPILNPARKINNWKNCRLTDLKIKDGHRFKVEKVVDERVLAILLKIKDVKNEVWLPKDRIEIGIHPSGNFYAVDVPSWLAKAKHLL